MDEDKRGEREAGSGLDKRSLRRVYSPGTLLDGAMLVRSSGGQQLSSRTQWLAGSSLVSRVVVKDPRAACHTPPLPTSLACSARLPTYKCLCRMPAAPSHW